jgi:hypothetical protein
VSGLLVKHPALCSPSRYHCCCQCASKCSTVFPPCRQCNQWGLSVIRMWAFNSKCPQSKGVYDETQMRAYDYVGM